MKKIEVSGAVALERWYEIGMFIIYRSNAACSVSV